jgi:hypothetical protein
MKMDEVTLLKAIKERANDPRRFVDLPNVINKKHELPPPVTPAELSQAEERLGFDLPELLRNLYLQVGDGGFGPGYGFLALNSNGAKKFPMNHLVDRYLDGIAFTHPDYPSWPRFFVTLCDWGDGIQSTMNAKDPAGAVMRCRGDAYVKGPWENVMRVEAASLHDWLEDWVNDLPLFERAQW